MKKKYISCLVILTMVILGLVPFSVSAASVSDTNDTKEATVLNSFLTDLKNGDTHSAFSMLSDERFALQENIKFEDLTPSEKAYIEYVSSGKNFAEMYNNKPIVNFKILKNETVVNEKNITILARLFFKNGEESIVPFSIANDKVVVDLNDISAKGYKVIKEVKDFGAENFLPDVSEKSLKDIITPKYSGFQWKDDYTFSYLFGTIYGVDTFSISKYVINFDGEQWNNDYPTWQTEASVIYAVCKTYWYGDDVWGSTGNPIVLNGTFDVYFQGKNNNFTDCKIRITNTTGSNPRSRGNGDVYQCDN
jgi:hypothetical protein